MPGTITSDMTDIDLAEATTNQATLGTFGAAPAVNDDPKIQGSYCIDSRVTANSAWALAASNVNLNTGLHIFHQQRNDAVAATDTIALGGQGISISSDTAPTLTGTTPSNGPTNSKTQYLNGNDGDILGGWTCFAVDPTSTPSLTLGSCTLTAVRRIGIRAKVLGTISTKSKNILYDALRVGTGITIVDGYGRTPVTISDILSTVGSNTNAWGVVTQISGIYYAVGKMTFGKSDQTNVTVFEDTNKTIVYRNFPVASTFYEIKTIGETAKKTSFTLGSYDRQAKIASGGYVIKGAGSGSSQAIQTLNASSSNQTTRLFGCSLNSMKSGDLTNQHITHNLSCTITINSATLTTASSFDTIGIVLGMSVTGTGIASETYVKSIESSTSLTLDKIATSSGTNTITFDCSSEILYCLFDDCGTLTPKGCAIENSSFKNLRTTSPISATYALIINSPDEMSKIKNTSFINCNYAIKLTADGTYTFDNLTFYGNIYDIENASSSSTVQVNCINGSNASQSKVYNSNGGTCTIKNMKELLITGLISGSEVRIYSHGTTTELGGVEDSQTTFSYQYDYVAGTYVDIVVHNVNYIYWRLDNYLLSSGNSSLPIQQKIDRTFSNPS